ncbi:AAA family ATPase [Candidatus Micrarchaeota archaeon]|nr:AAA family ATPase [Candidatus Micrarchaeota archaeon]
MRLKIAIIGSHGTGKTSLTHALVGKLKEHGLNAQYLPEMVRYCPIPTGTETRGSLDAQTWVLCSQLAGELEAAVKYDVVVCDHSVIDIHAYTVWHARNNPDVDKAQLKINSEIFDNWADHYDHTFKIALTKPPQEDGFRSTSEGWQREIDTIINELLESKKIHYKIIGPGTLEQRVDLILSELGMLNVRTV